MKDKPVDRDVDRMRERLARNTPADPADAGQADAVVNRARSDRRRRGVIGGVAVALFAAAVIVTPHFLKSSPTTNAGTDPNNGTEVSAGVDPWTTNACPKEPIDVSKVSKVKALSAGAVSVRVCRAETPSQAGADGTVESAWLPPPDALILDPDAFAEALTAAPDWDPARCAAIDVATSPFALEVSYADERIVLGSPMSMCSGVEIGGRTIESSEIIDAFIGALQSQRQSLAARPLSPDCGSLKDRGLSTLAVHTLAGAPVTGIVCYTADPQGAQDYADDEGTLTQSQAEELAADMRATRGVGSAGCIDTGPVRVIRLFDEWGDVSSWVDDRCSGDFLGPTGDWSPTDQSEQIISDVLGGPGA